MRSPKEFTGDALASVRLVLHESARSFIRNGGFDRSAALAFFGFLSLVPLLLLEVLVVTHAIRSSVGTAEIIESIPAQSLPVSVQFILKDVFAVSVGKTWGVLTVLLLVWSATPLASGMRSAFHAIFRPEKPIPFLKGMGMDVMAVLGALVLLGAAILGKLTYLIAVPVLSPTVREVARLLYGAVSVLGLPLALIVLYLVFVPVRLKMRHLLSGALITAILLGMVTPLFTFILKYNPDYGVIFGSMKTMFLLFIWVYYAFAMILFGTEIMANMARRDTLIISRLFTRPNRKPGSRRLLGRFVRVFSEGEVVFGEKDQGVAMYYVLSGSVDLTRAGRRFRTMKPGEYFGEMAMLLDTERTMSATAAEPDTELVTVSRENLEAVMHENPSIISSLLREMASRLRATDELLPTKGESNAPKG